MAHLGDYSLVLGHKLPGPLLHLVAHVRPLPPPAPPALLLLHLVQDLLGGLQAVHGPPKATTGLPPLDRVGHQPQHSGHSPVATECLLCRLMLRFGLAILLPSLGVAGLVGPPRLAAYLGLGLALQLLAGLTGVPRPIRLDLLQAVHQAALGDLLLPDLCGHLGGGDRHRRAGRCSVGGLGHGLGLGPERGGVLACLA